MENNNKNGDLNTAKQNLNFIWSYEVSKDRADKFEALKKELGV